MALQIGARGGPHEIGLAIGAGGVGGVYQAKDARLGRDVAIKVLQAGWTTDPERLRLFEREARAAAPSPPNILAVYDIGTRDGAPYTVSELLEAATPRDRLARGSRHRTDTQTRLASAGGVGPVGRLAVRRSSTPFRSSMASRRRTVAISSTAVKPVHNALVCDSAVDVVCGSFPLPRHDGIISWTLNVIAERILVDEDFPGSCSS